MDGRYTLSHDAVDGAAELAVTGARFRARVPAAAAVDRAFESHAAAVAAMNAELTRLTRSGWSIADVATGDDDDDTARDSEKAPPLEPDDVDDDADAVATRFDRDASTVTVNAGASEVTRDEATAALAAELATAPCHELVVSDWPELGGPDGPTVEPWCHALARVGSDVLRRFVVDTDFEPHTRQTSVGCGDITDVFRACPSLAVAYVIGRAEIRVLAHERLEDLTLMADALTVGTIQAVFRGACPRLERLAIGLAYARPAAADADRALVAAFAENGLPALAELHIAHPNDAVALLDALATVPAFAGLRVLSIAGNVFEDEERGLEVLQKHHDALSRLERLHLPLEDVMTRTDDELVAIVPSLRSIRDANAFRRVTPSVRAAAP